MQELIQKMLVELGEDPEREGLLKTPERVSEGTNRGNSCGAGGGFFT